MSKRTIFFLFLILMTSLQAQDRLITTKKDTIACRIVTINDGRILYEVKDKNGSVTGTFIDMSQVASYSRTVPTANKARQTTVKTKSESPGWTHQLSMGKSTMPWYWDGMTTEDTELDYYKQIETGYHFESCAVYWTTEHIGYGLDYSFFTSGFHGKVLTTVGSDAYSTVTERFDQYVHFFGPTIQFLQYLDKRHRFSLNESFSAGAFVFRLEDQTTIPYIQSNSYTDYTVNTLLTSSNLAAKIGLTAGYRKSKNITLGFGSAITYANFKKANLTMRNPENSTSVRNRELSKTFLLSRLDYAIVVRYQY